MRMKTKASYGKISAFLRTLKRKNTKRNQRPSRAAINVYPSSTKVGAGNAEVIRRNPNSIMCRVNYRKGSNKRRIVANAQ